MIGAVYPPALSLGQPLEVPAPKPLAPVTTSRFMDEKIRIARQEIGPVMSSCLELPLLVYYDLGNGGRDGQSRMPLLQKFAVIG